MTPTEYRERLMQALGAARRDLLVMDRLADPEARAHFMDAAREALRLYRIAYAQAPIGFRLAWKHGGDR